MQESEVHSGDQRCHFQVQPAPVHRGQPGRASSQFAGQQGNGSISEQLQGSGVDQVGFHNQWAFGSAPATCRTLLYTPGGKATNDDALDPGDPLSILEQVFVPCGREVLLLSLWQSSLTHTDFGEGRPQSHSRVEVAHRKPIS